MHVCVNAHREIPEPDRTNNGAVIPVADVLPVDPAAFEISPAATVPSGEILLAGEGFGPEPGRVLVHLAGRELDGEIIGWHDMGVRVRLPAADLAGPIAAEVIVIRGDGAATNPLQVTLTPPWNAAYPAYPMR